jgi:hypothetical protein
MGACNLANSASWSFPSLLKSMMYDGFRVAVNCPHFNERPERRRVDAHDNFSARAAFNRQGGVDRTSAEIQVEDLPRKEKAVGWEEADLRDTSTTESPATGPIVVSLSMLRHEYSIVCRAMILETTSR